ncbi:MAG: septum formation initiator family protein [Patescibacteria group bacterium]
MLLRRKISRTKIVAVISLVLLILFGLNLVKELISRRQIDRQIRNLENEARRLQSDNEQISSLIESWSNKDYSEKEARLKLGLQKPGERTILILREGEDAITNEIGGDSEKVGNILVPVEHELPNPVKWWRYFFKPH